MRQGGWHIGPGAAVGTVCTVRVRFMGLVRPGVPELRRDSAVCENHALEKKSIDGGRRSKNPAFHMSASWRSSSTIPGPWLKPSQCGLGRVHTSSRQALK